MLLPCVNGVRLATLDDLPRIAIVAAAAFFWSPTFRFQRPHYKDFPADTLASYWNEYEEAIRNPAYVVLIAEDILEPDEAEHVYEALQLACRSSSLGQKAIVGVCSLMLKPDSSYAGYLQPASKHVSGAHFYPSETVEASQGPQTLLTRCKNDHLKRDQCPQATKIYEAVTGPPKSRHLAGRMRLSTVAVFPAYWHRGHATRLVRFCTQLADLDDALLGISATPHGALVAAKAGFEECEIVRLDRQTVHEERGDGELPNAAGVVLWIGIRLPSGRSPSCGDTSRSRTPEEMQ